jgi:hypothetical protein
VASEMDHVNVVAGPIKPATVHTVGCCGVVIGFAAVVVSTQVQKLDGVHVLECGL